MWACSHVYEGLFILDSNTALKPLLADSFWVEANQLNYHFKLKKASIFIRIPVLKIRIAVDHLMPMMSPIPFFD